MTKTEVCPNCGEFVDELDFATGFCYNCSPTNLLVERYLEQHADEIEHYLMQGLSLNKAIDALHASNGRSRTCIVCGSAMPHAPRTAVFCRGKKECRRFARRYVYLYSERGLSKSEALAKVMEEIT
jgi:hypothetical protein